MQTSDDQGFTVIEVMLFLGVSALMIVMVFVGMGAQIARTRFNDGIRSTQAFLQQQYSDVVSGLNDRDASVGCNRVAMEVTSLVTNEPGKSDCLLLGRVVTLQSGSVIKSYPVIGATPLVAPAATATEGEVVAAYNPTVVTAASTVRSYDIPWGAGIDRTCRGVNSAVNETDPVAPVGTCTGDPATRQIDSYLLIRSPLSGEVISYTFNQSGGTFPKGRTLALTSPTEGYINFSNGSVYQQPTNICIKSADGATYGAVRVGGLSSAGQTAITAVAGLGMTEMESACGI
ncbi:MAG: Tfp pilus assembly protein FimT/FimU [Acidobacteriota bacterium]